MLIFVSLRFFIIILSTVIDLFCFKIFLDVLLEIGEYFIILFFVFKYFKDGLFIFDS